MGEGTTGMNDFAADDVAARPRADAIGEIEHDIESIRGDLGDLVGELDRRRHEALDVRLQLRRHAPTVMTLAAGVCLWIVVRALRASSRRRTAEAMATRLGNLTHALMLLARTEPERLTAAIR